MFSPSTQDVARHYTQRHALRGDLFGDKPYANLGYWPREGMTLPEACDALTDLVAATAELGPGDRVLEVGCGYGASAVYYGQRYRPASVVGIDVTDVRIQEGRDYVARHGLADTIQLRLGDATALPFDAGAFTKVLAVECAFHFDTRQDFLREAARVLDAGGRLALTDIIPMPGVDAQNTLLGRPGLGTGVHLDMPANAYGAEQYAQYLAEAGFEEIRIESILEQTRARFAEEVDRLGKQTGGERGATLVALAQRHRDAIAAGTDYVLVAARKGGTPGR